MKMTTHEHQGGLAALPVPLRQEIENAVSACEIAPARRAASKIGDAIMVALNKEGWSGEVALAGRASKISITSMKQETGLCMQTGNMSRMYADLLKLQHMFLSNTIKVGAMIVPSHDAAKNLGDNIANADRLTRELDIFRKVIHMPLVVFAFY
ncbi:MAG: hypothetical protein LBL59_02775 [Xanthomonadaceae bacterium]|jgi:hypothetical protein|uniref:BglII/BstYI family type II restriction endonuclease n=1 Tax=Xanthomonas axonopodis TaxID=53413 RepID=UPI002819515B|nr:hypothetical protein [Xanthomonadaceae bacterium]